MSFSGTPRVPDNQPMPTITDTAVIEARNKELRAALLRKGRASTILTDLQATEKSPTLAKSSLLGVSNV